MRESKVETHLRRRWKAIGGEVRKLTWLCRRGAPDRLLMLPGGRLWFVELKAPGKTAEDHQAREHARLWAMGQKVLVLDTIEAVDQFVDGVEHGRTQARGSAV
jgi:hypothetical protein